MDVTVEKRFLATCQSCGWTSGPGDKNVVKKLGDAHDCRDESMYDDDSYLPDE